MKTYINPPKESWEALLKRPQFDPKKLDELIYTIIEKVKTEGDSALKEYALQFDQVALNEITVSESEINQAKLAVDQSLKDAIQLAHDNIYSFHQSQKQEEKVVETTQGVKCWRKSVAIEKVGLYIPGGSAPLFSTILMLGIPAKIAGCSEVILCTPPS